MATETTDEGPGARATEQAPYLPAPGCGGCDVCARGGWRGPAVHLDRGCAEWDAAWRALGERYGGDPVCRHPSSGEAWQYMGTHYSHDQGVRWRWVHQFRHRDLPAQGRRWWRGRAHVDIPATPGAVWCERGRRIVG